MAEFNSFANGQQFALKNSTAEAAPAAIALALHETKANAARNSQGLEYFQHWYDEKGDILDAGDKRIINDPALTFEQKEIRINHRHIERRSPENLHRKTRGHPEVYIPQPNSDFSADARLAAEHNRHVIIANQMPTRLRFQVSRLSAAKGKQLAGPPNLQTSTGTRRWYRFLASAGTARAINVGNILTSMGVVTSTTPFTSGTAVHSSFKLLMVRAWTSPQSSDAVTSYIQWLVESGNVPDEEKVASVIPFVSGIGYLSERPPKNSLASFWWDSGAASTTLFELFLPIGSFIDVYIQGRLTNELSPLASIALTTPTSSGVYYTALDGVSTNTYTPVGMISAH